MNGGHDMSTGDTVSNVLQAVSSGFKRQALHSNPKWCPVAEIGCMYYLVVKRCQYCLYKLIGRALRSVSRTVSRLDGRRSAVSVCDGGSSRLRVTLSARKADSLRTCAI